ncbi:MAG: LysE family translocator [Pseudomonadota bacterium]
MDDINLWLIVGTALLAGFTPGPGTFAIAGTAMARGRRHGLALAYGMTGGALIWAVCAALGIGAVLTANAWAFETLRYAGAAYLAWLGYRSARAALRPRDVALRDLGQDSLALAALRGMLIHLTNPKVLFYWASIFVVGVKPGGGAEAVFWVVAVSLAMNVLIVTTWALIFSRPAVMAGYARFRRWIEGAFAAVFGAAAWAVATQRTA